MALTQFSGFSGKSIDILGFHDSENKELTPTRHAIFSTLSCLTRLISVLDFIWRSRDVTDRTLMVNPNCGSNEGLT